MTTCDNCGSATQDKDEILCRKCKPSLQIRAEIAETEETIRHLKDEIDAAYWKFTRQARALPPSMQCPNNSQETANAENKLRELKRKLKDTTP